MSGQSRFSCPIWVTTVMSPPLFCLVMFVVLMVHLFGLPVTHLEPNHALELFTLCSFSTSFFFSGFPLCVLIYSRAGILDADLPPRGGWAQEALSTSFTQSVARTPLKILCLLVLRLP